MLTADKMRYDDINKIGNAEGHVHYTSPESKLDAQKADYYMNGDDERVEAFWECCLYRERKCNYSR